MEALPPSSYLWIIFFFLVAFNLALSHTWNTVIYYCCCLVTKVCPTLLRPHGLARQAPLSMGFPRSGLPFPSAGDLPDPGSNPRPLHWQVDSLPLSYQGSPVIFVHVLFPFLGRKLLFQIWYVPDSSWYNHQPDTRPPCVLCLFNKCLLSYYIRIKNHGPWSIEMERCPQYT